MVVVHAAAAAIVVVAGISVVVGVGVGVSVVSTHGRVMIGVIRVVMPMVKM